MLRGHLLCLLLLTPIFAAGEDWISLFNGKDLTGWQPNENPETWLVEDGAIVAHGGRSHCYYMGPVLNHNFRNFELTVDVKAKHNSNGGVYILTHYEPKGWPQYGFEVQVNNTYDTDPRKTGSLYEVQDVAQQLVPDDTWFTEHITVRGDTITVRVNGKQVVQWKQPDDWIGTSDFPGRRIQAGTIALQRHDASSTVYYRNIRFRALPDAQPARR